MPVPSEILTVIQAACTHGDVTVDEASTPVAVRIPKDDVINVCSQLLEHPSTYFDMLSCLTAIDNGAATNTMEVAYNLYSIPFNVQLMLKVTLPRENPEVETVGHIWKTALWHEREAFDMFGIHFKNHPDLRRILLPADWEGHPLKKDYQQQEYYRSVKVAY